MYLYNSGYKYGNNVNEISQVNYENYKLFDYSTDKKKLWNWEGGVYKLYLVTCPFTNIIGWVY